MSIDFASNLPQNPLFTEIFEEKTAQFTKEITDAFTKINEDITNTATKINTENTAEIKETQI